MEDDLLQVACYSPLRIPEGSRRDIAEALVREFDDSELRFQVAQITEGESVGEAVIDLFQVVGHSPLLVLEGCRPPAAETIARANYGLRLGKFELDFADGELRFQVSQILVDEAVGQAVIDRMIGTALWCTGTKRPGRRLGGWLWFGSPVSCTRPRSTTWRIRVRGMRLADKRGVNCTVRLGWLVSGR